MSVSNLPLRVLANIVDYVTEHADHVSLMLVCKGWSKTVAQAMYRAPPLQSPDSFERLMGLLNTPLPAHPYPTMIRELDISGMAADNLYMGDLDAALGMCPNLEVFRLENCFHISNILLKSIAHHCPGLLQLDLPGCPVSDSFIPILVKKCQRLLRLDVSFTNATVASIHPVMEYSESLLELDLSECQEAEDLQMLDLTPRGFRRPLKSLNLRNTPITDELLTFAVSQCPDLEVLVLESCQRITDASIIAIMKHCNKLRSLDCSFLEQITDASIQAITARAEEEPRGGSLEELYLCACDLITPPAVHQMVQRSSGMQLLVLDGCDKILGSFVHKHALLKGDDALECTLNADQLRSLADHNPGALATPPSSPGRKPDDSAASGLKVEVEYASDFADDRKRRKANAGFAAAVMRSMLGPNGEAKPVTSEAGGLGSEGATSPGLQRRPSRTLRHRRSLLNLSIKNTEDDSSEVEEAARYERQERIRERRRSRGLSVDRSSLLAGFDSPPSPPDFGSSNNVEPPRSVLGESEAPVSSPVEAAAPPLIQSSPMSGDDAAAKAAFVIAAAAKGLKVAPPTAAHLSAASSSASKSFHSSTASSPSSNPFSPPPSTATSPSPGLRRKTSNLSLKASEFVPSTASVATPVQPKGPSANASWIGAAPVASAAAATPAEAPRRKMSFTQPTPPPASGGWSTPVGIAPSSVLATPATPAAAPVAPAPATSTPAAAPAPEDKILLFSGRAARSNSVSSKDAAAAAAAVQSSTEGSDGEKATILIASGRRRSRAGSISGPAAAATAAAEGATTEGGDAWGAVKPTVVAAPWGADPAVWNGGSTTTTPAPAPPAPAGGFVDPWAKPGASSTTAKPADPWAATPAATPAPFSSPSNTNSGFTPPSFGGYGNTAPAPSSNAGWPVTNANANNNFTSGFNSANNFNSGFGGATATSNSGIRTVAGAGWSAGQQQQQNGRVAAQTPSTPTTPPRPQRPTLPGGRFGSVGAAAARVGGGATWNSPGSAPVAPAAAPSAPVAAPVAPVASVAAVVPVKEEVKVEGGKEPFVYSEDVEKRGRLLLKLKVETKAGGHQTLAVHEFDDPSRLATEFVMHWDMEAFKEPLIRLISVRRSNVLRTRAR